MSWYRSEQATATEPLAPPDWYPDPSGAGELRYWDGSAWTPGVVVRGQVEERPLPPPGQAPVARADPRPPLPARAALLALAGVVVGLALSIGLSLLGLAAGLPRTVRLVVSQAGLWTGLVGACWLASRRFGRGSLVGDFGLRVRGADVGWGLLAALAARFAVGMAVLPFLLSGSKRLLGANDRVFRVVKDDPAGFVVVAVLAVLGAPVVEELFFRGLLQGSLLSSLGVAQAIVVQALLFGVAHVNPILGLANVTVVVAITAAGIVFGVTAGRRGLPSSMVAHGAFNAVAVAVAATL